MFQAINRIRRLQPQFTQPGNPRGRTQPTYLQIGLATSLETLKLLLKRRLLPNPLTSLLRFLLKPLRQPGAVATWTR